MLRALFISCYHPAYYGYRHRPNRQTVFSPNPPLGLGISNTLRLGPFMWQKVCLYAGLAHFKTVCRCDSFVRLAGSAVSPRRPPASESLPHSILGLVLSAMGAGTFSSVASSTARTALSSCHSSSRSLELEGFFSVLVGGCRLQ